MLRYQRGKIREQPPSSDDIGEYSYRTADWKNEKKLGPFATIFAIQAMLPKDPSFAEPKGDIQQRSLPWKGMSRWRMPRMPFWNGGSTGVRRKFIYDILEYGI